MFVYSSFSWWEGVVTEKSKKDETSFNVHFPGTSDQVQHFIFNLDCNGLSIKVYAACALRIIKVFFIIFVAAQGETSVVKAWLLCPSLMWKNSSWVEWSTSRDNNGSSHEVIC